MPASAIKGSNVRRVVLKAVPFVVIALAGMAVRTPLAAAYPFAALLLFLWIVADTMMLALIASSSGRPPIHAVLGVMAAASASVWLLAPPAIRDMLWATPALAIAMAIMVIGHLALASVRASRVLRAEGEPAAHRWTAAASIFLPPGLVRLATAELAIIHMAFFRWGRAGDIPANCRGFAYHRHLAPICATFLVLSAIEIAVYHVLVGHWSQTAAVIMFIVSDIGFIYLVGLIKSFRFRPVLVTPDAVRIRTGLLIDQSVPLDAIARIETSFDGDSVRDPATLNAALMAWPNILLRLDRPIHRRSLLKGSKAYGSIAFRLDDPAAFTRILQWRLEATRGD